MNPNPRAMAPAKSPCFAGTFVPVIKSGLPRACSGDKYAAVPKIRPARVGEIVSVGECSASPGGSSAAFANPKSRIFTTPYLFCSNIGTALLERNVLRDLYKVLQVAGLGRRSMHDLRHSCVTLLGAQGVPLRTIADIVGHSDIRVDSERVPARVYEHEARCRERTRFLT